ncbi:MAG: hypothetical protein M5U28_21465 [Sandaracinaceae bacterium]|nr:hypothetical protein [Sandaracinaceae bacterium]
MAVSSGGPATPGAPLKSCMRMRRRFVSRSMVASLGEEATSRPTCVRRYCTIEPLAPSRSR